tara:strand:- start:113 stop:748 length:636 start_codon:yes stop_codon:yes gene_type:complete
MKIHSIQSDRENDGGEHGIKGGRPPVYDYAAFEKEMIENDPDHYYLSEHMKLWTIKNWGLTRERIQESFRKTLWAKFAGPSKESAKATKDRRQTIRGRLQKRSASFRNRSGAEKTYWKGADLIDYLEEFQGLDLDNATCIDFYDGTVIDLNNEVWQFDHYERGDNSLDNLVVTREQYNQMKNCWTVDETLDACVRLIEFWRPNLLKDTGEK